MIGKRDMGQRKLEDHEALSWGNYKAIARELNRVHRDIDVMILHRARLIELICDLERFVDKKTKPDQYTLDDIRFEWFFLKKGNGDNAVFKKLRSNF